MILINLEDLTMEVEELITHELSHRFLLHENAARRDAFRAYLAALAAGRDSTQAFEQELGKLDWDRMKVPPPRPLLVEAIRDLCYANVDGAREELETALQPSASTSRPSKPWRSG